MGKFNWKRGLAMASYGLRENAEQKRAYERDERALNMTMAEQLAKSGQTLPPELKAKIGEELATMYEKYGSMMQESERKKYEQEMNDFMFKEKFKESLKPKDQYEGVADSVKAVQQHFNITPEEWKAMPNDVRNRKRAEYYELSRKSDGVNGNKDKKPTIRIFTKDGITYQYNIDTKEKIVIDAPSPEEKEKKDLEKKTKEGRERQKLEAQYSMKAQELFNKFYENDDRNKEAMLPSLNATLAEIGWKIVPPKVETVNWGPDKKLSDWHLEKAKSVDQYLE